MVPGHGEVSALFTAYWATLAGDLGVGNPQLSADGRLTAHANPWLCQMRDDVTEALTIDALDWMYSFALDRPLVVFQFAEGAEVFACADMNVLKVGAKVMVPPPCAQMAVVPAPLPVAEVDEFECRFEWKNLQDTSCETHT